MRAELHKAVASWPGTVLPNAIGVGGIFAGLFPEKFKHWISGMTTDQVYLWAAGAVCICLAYWVLRLSLRPSAPDSALSAGDQFTQTHHGSGHNIGKIENAHFGKQPFTLTEQDIAEIVAQLYPGAPVHLVAVLDHAMGGRLRDALIMRGFVIQRYDTPHAIGVNRPLNKPVNIAAGPTLNQIFLDPT
jgi:hypothetical protein